MNIRWFFDEHITHLIWKRMFDLPVPEYHICFVGYNFSIFKLYIYVTTITIGNNLHLHSVICCICFTDSFFPLRFYPFLVI